MSHNAWILADTLDFTENWRDFLHFKIKDLKANLPIFQSIILNQNEFNAYFFVFIKENTHF